MFALASISYHDYEGLAVNADEKLRLQNNLGNANFMLLRNHGGLTLGETIGDAFMAVSGVSIETKKPIVQLADFSLAVARRLKLLVLDLDVPLGFRIGIHAGPLIAGVIGETRTSFDVWGDTVNMASRLESHAGIGEIACSQNVYEALLDTYDFEQRAAVEMKGKGEQVLWALKGIKQ